MVTLMETSVVNIPIGFLPCPFAEGDLQRADGEVFVWAAKAPLVEEGKTRDSHLLTPLETIVTPARYAEMVRCPYEAWSIDTAERIASGGSDPSRLITPCARSLVVE
jgi:hypothetical protein